MCQETQVLVPFGIKYNISLMIIVEKLIRRWDNNNALSALTDDDKHHMDIQVAAEKLKKSRFVRENRQGMKCHAGATTSIDFFLETE